VPRWHIAWGTGWEIIDKLVKALECHPQRNNLQLVFDHEVNEIDFEGGKVVGVSGRRMDDSTDYTARGEATIIASGGICGGDMSFLRENWFKEWGEPPKKILNGAHQYGDGMLHKVAQKHGAWLTHLDLSEPPVDFVALAQGMGMSATAVSTAGGFNKALENAFKEPGPHLIDAIVPSEFKGLKLKALPHVLGALGRIPAPLAKAIKKKIAP
jgi:succinate dehydrogenase/fumarate reductase flavoprotein subunit